MSTSATAVRDLVALSIGVAESAATGQILLCPFERFSIAKTEKDDIAAAGITDEDVTSMFTVQTMLDSYIRAATEHIRAAAVLMGSNESTMPLLSIAALGRISCEASGVAFWLCNPDLCWEDRLRRCNQLQFKMIKDALRGSKDFRDLFQTSWIDRSIDGYKNQEDTVLDWARQRSWDYQGSPPSRSNWSKEVPTFTQLVRELVESSGEPAVLGQMLYSVGSGAVHSNPILVDRSLYELTPASRQYSAALKLKTALRCYCLLRDRIAEWTGWEPETDWFGAVEHRVQRLFIAHLSELPYLPVTAEEIQEYRQHLSEVFELAWDQHGEPFL